MDFVIKGGISKGVYVTDRGAFLRVPSPEHRTYSKQSIKSIFKFIIDNAFLVSQRFSTRDLRIHPCVFVRSSVRPAVFSETAHWNFLIFCMKLLWDKCRKVTVLFFSRKFLISGLRGINLKKWQKTSFFRYIF